MHQNQQVTVTTSEIQIRNHFTSTDQHFFSFIAFLLDSLFYYSFFFQIQCRLFSFRITCEWCLKRKQHWHLVFKCVGAGWESFDTLHVQTVLTLNSASNKSCPLGRPYYRRPCIMSPFVFHINLHFFKYIFYLLSSGYKEDLSCRKWQEDAVSWQLCVVSTDSSVETL